MITVLYVDDDPDLADLARIFLGREKDLSVKSVLSAREALEAVDSNKVDLVVSDYQMPEIDGISLFQILRLKEREMPFILFTGIGREDVAAKALETGVDFYVRKGGDPKVQFHALTAKIRTAYRHHEATRLFRAHSERLDLAFKASDEGIIDIDLSRGEIFACSRCAEILGYVPGDEPVTVAGWLSLVHPEDHQVLVQTIREAVKAKGENSFVAETRVIHREGDWRWVLVQGIVLPSPDTDAPNRLVATVRDITPWKRREERDNRAVALYTQILEEQEDGLLLLDCEGMMILWNQRFETIWEIKPGTIDTLTPLNTCLSLIGRVQDPAPLLQGLDPRGSEGNEPRSGTLVTMTNKEISWETEPFIERGETQGTLWRFFTTARPVPRKAVTLMEQPVPLCHVSSDRSRPPTTTSRNVTDIRIPLPTEGKSVLLGKEGTITAWSRAFGEVSCLPPPVLEGADPMKVLAFPDADTEESFVAALHGGQIKSFPCAIRTRDGPLHTQVTLTPLDQGSRCNQGAFLFFQDPI